MKQHLIINKNLHRTILNLAIPGMINSVLQTLYQLIDAYWVGKLGAGALAAIGGCSFVLWAVLSLTAFSVNGITTLVAQKIGAGNEEGGQFAAGQGMLISTVFAVFLTIAILLFQDQLYDLMGFSPEVFGLAREYMTVIILGLIFIFWFTSLEAVFRGLGDTKTPMIILGIALGLNAVLDPVFIFGEFGLPEMGIAGAALATVVAQFIAAVLCFYFLKKKNFIPSARRKNKIQIDNDIIYKILAIGAPIAFGGFFFSIIYVFLTNIISRFGTEAVAAIGVCHRIEGVAWFACVGFSVAAATLVGQNIGAGRLGSAQKAAWWVNGYGVLTLFAVSLIFYFFPDRLINIFTSDPTVRQIGIEYLRIIAIFEIFLALEVIVEGIFSGAGYTLPVMLVTIPTTAARIPLAWFFALPLNLGVSGIWWAIGLTTFLKGFLNLILFWAGIWKSKIEDKNAKKNE